MIENQRASEAVTLTELEDEPGKVYAIGMNLDDLHENDIDDIIEAFDMVLEEAEFVLVSLPIEGSVEISEIDPEEIQEVIDYNDVMSTAHERGE